MFTGARKSKKRTKKKPDKQGGKQNSPNKPDGDHVDTNHHGDQSSDLVDLNVDPMLGYTAWSKLSSSDSDWSEPESGQGSRSRSNFTKVRQCALSCFYWITKVCFM